MRRKARFTMCASDRVSPGWIVFSLATSVLVSCGVSHNPQPSECRRALGIELNAARAPDFLLLDSAAARTALQLADLAGQSSEPWLPLDSLVAVHGEARLLQSVTAIMWGHVTDGHVNIGWVYPRLGGEWGYLAPLLVDSIRSFDQRRSALSAVDAGLSRGMYRDTATAEALVGMMCEMAYLLRPFVGTDFAAHVMEHSNVREYALRQADGLHSLAIETLGLKILPGGLDLLERYAKWEPQPVLREKAADKVLFLTDKEAYVDKYKEQR